MVRLELEVPAGMGGGVVGIMGVGEGAAIDHTERMKQIEAVQILMFTAIVISIPLSILFNSYLAR